MAIVIAGTIVWSGAILASARSAEPVTNADCVHALDDRSLVKPCERNLGWHITRHLAMTRHQVVRAHNIAPCTFEDGSGGPLPCGWNFGGMHTGDGEGRVYWVGKARHIHYVWDGQPKPERAHWPSGAERKRLAITKACWVIRVGPHQYRHACP